MRWTTGISFLLIATVCAAQTPEPARPKIAADVYKNLQVLGAVPADEWFPTMSFVADSLGVTCDHCHAQQFESDEKPAKLKARQMMTMTREMNDKYFAGAGVVTCNTCHRGALKTAATPIPDVEHWLRSSRAKNALPPAADLISRYRALIGTSAELEKHSQTVTVRTTTYPIDGSVRVADSDIAIGGPDRARATVRRDKASTTYVRDGQNGWITDGTVWHAMTRGQLRDLSNDLAALRFDDLGDISDAVTIGAETVNGRDAYLLEARAGSRRTWLFFDADSGLLLRRRGFESTYFAEHTWDAEYLDYKPVGKFLLPGMVRVVNPAGSGLTVRTITARKFDPKLDPSLFKDPRTPSAGK